MRFLPAVLMLTVSAVAQGWIDVTPTTLGPATTAKQGTMCYDPVRGVTWLFSSVPGPSAFSWDGVAWTAASQGPPHPYPTASAWDPVLQQVVVGFTATPSPTIPTCRFFSSWDGTNWANPTDTGVELICPVLAFDVVRAQLVLMTLPSTLGPIETRILSGGSWILRYSSVVPVIATTAHLNQPLTTYYDEVRGRVQLLTNNTTITTSTSGSYFTGCWEWTGSNWAQIFTSEGFGMIGRVASNGQGRNLCVRYPSSSYAPPAAFDIQGGQFTRLYLSAYPASRLHHLLAYDSGRGCFVLHGGSFSSGPPLPDTWELTLGPTAGYSSFGTGCMGTRGIPSLVPQGGPPTIGTPFSLQVGNLPFTGPAFLFFGYSNQNYGVTPLPFNLGGFGAPACNLRVSGDVLFSITNVLGVSTWGFLVPNYPGLTFYNQAFAFDPAANALGLTVSNGGAGVIGS